MIWERKPLKLWLRKRQKKKKVFWRAIERSWRERENRTKLIYQTLRIWNFQILISREESSSDQKKVLKIFDWLRSNWIGIERDRDFWPKNWIFLIDRGSASINQASEKFWKFENLGNFAKNQLKTSIYDIKCTWMLLKDFKNNLLSNFQTFHKIDVKIHLI